MNGVDFGSMPCVYWSNKTKISYLQRRIIVYSIMYYEFSESCVSDKQFDAIAHQLVEMHKEYPEEYKQSQYYYAMHDFDGTTGFDIPSRLKKLDRAYLTDIAKYVMRNMGKVKIACRFAERCDGCGFDTWKCKKSDGACKFSIQSEDVQGND